MTKRSGLGQRFAAGGYDLSGDTLSLGRIGGGPAVLAVTGIDKSAHERIGGRIDGTIELTTAFNDAADQAHDVYSALPTATRQLLFAFGNTIGEGACGLAAKQVNYDGAVGDDGSFQLQVAGQAADGFALEWGDLLTPYPRDDGASNVDGASVDNGAGSSAGIVAYLQVFAIASGSATVAIQQSSDDGGADAFVNLTGATFAAVTTPRTAQRIETADSQSVERYLRVATTGTYTGLSFAVMVHRRPTLA